MKKGGDEKEPFYELDVLFAEAQLNFELTTRGD